MTRVSALGVLLFAMTLPPAMASAQEPDRNGLSLGLAGGARRQV